MKVWIFKRTVFENEKLIDNKVRMQISGIDTIKPSTIPDPGYQWESNKLRHHKREPTGQPFPSR